MRLGVLSPTFPPDICGIGDFTAHMVKRLLVATEIDIAVISREREGSTAPDFNVGRGSFSFFPVIRDFEKHILEDVGQIITRKEIECLWIQYNRSLYQASSTLNFLPKLLKKNLPSLKILGTVHDFPLPVRQLDPFFYLSSISFLRHCDQIVFTNECDRNKYLSRIFGGASRCSVIPSGPNIVLEEGYSPKDFRKQLGIGDRENLILYFGMLRPDKSLFSLLYAVDLLQSRSVPVHLVLVGKDPGGKYSRYLHSYLKKPGKEKYFHVLKELPAPEVSSLLKQSDLVVLPYSDGVTEKRGSFAAAVTHECNIVTTRTGATSSFIYDNPSIIFTKSLRTKDLAEAIQAGLESPPKGPDVQAKKKEIKEFFDWNQIVKKYILVFQGLLRS